MHSLRQPGSSGRGAIAEVGEVAFGAAGQVFVVARHRVDAVLVAAPGRAVAVVELLERAGLVGVIAQAEDRAGQVVEEGAGLAVPFQVALGDIACGEHDHGAGSRWGCRLGSILGQGIRGRQERNGQHEPQGELCGEAVQERR